MGGVVGWALLGGFTSEEAEEVPQDHGGDQAGVVGVRADDAGVSLDAGQHFLKDLHFWQFLCFLGGRSAFLCVFSFWIDFGM